MSGELSNVIDEQSYNHCPHQENSKFLVVLEQQVFVQPLFQMELFLDPMSLSHLFLFNLLILFVKSTYLGALPDAFSNFSFVSAVFCSASVAGAKIFRGS